MRDIPDPLSTVVNLKSKMWPCNKAELEGYTKKEKQMSQEWQALLKNSAQTHKESSAFVCILGLQKILPTDPTHPASLVLFLFWSWFQADFYYLEQFQMLTGTLYIYKDKEAFNNNYIQAPWKELGKVCQL